MSERTVKRLNRILTVVMIFILAGYPFSVWYQYENWNHSPLLFRMNAEPWYVRSVSDGILVVIAVSGCLLIKKGLKTWKS